MICPHVVTENNKDALSYCQICAPKYIALMEKWVNDLHSEMYINCVYCGHRYGPKESTPVSMADILKEHIEKCPKHPMSKLKSQLTQIEETVKSCICQKYGSDGIRPHDICRKIINILSSTI
jgi:hypothetical protein